MTSGVYLSVVLPAYNEGGSIRSTLEAMRAFLDRQGYTYEIVVAADGDDDTPRIVSEMARDWPALKLTAQPGRRGKGHGLRRGMKLVSGEIVGFIDADYKTPIDEIEGFLPWFDAGYDLVAGSRALDDSRVEVYQPLYRQVGSLPFAVAIDTLVGLHHIKDTQCGFKFFTQACAPEIFQRARIDGYMCDVEILVLAERLAFPVRGVGILWRDDGDSRLELVRGNLENAYDLLRIRIRSPTRFAQGYSCSADSLQRAQPGSISTRALQPRGASDIAEIDSRLGYGHIRHVPGEPSEPPTTASLPLAHCRPAQHTLPLSAGKGDAGRVGHAMVVHAFGRGKGRNGCR